MSHNEDSKMKNIDVYLESWNILLHKEKLYGTLKNYTKFLNLISRKMKEFEGKESYSARIKS